MYINSKIDSLFQTKILFIIHILKVDSFDVARRSVFYRTHKRALSNLVHGHQATSTVVERFFGSLKHEGLGHTATMNEDAVKQEITQFIHYYNFKRPHTANNGMSPLEFENSQIKMSYAA